MTPHKVFDPGGFDDCFDDIANDDIDVDELDCIVLCMDALMAATDVLHTRPAAFREGEFVVNETIAKMFNVLWDSGACHRSYVSKHIVDSN